MNTSVIEGSNPAFFAPVPAASVQSAVKDVCRFALTARARVEALTHAGHGVLVLGLSGSSQMYTFRALWNGWSCALFHHSAMPAWVEAFSTSIQVMCAPWSRRGRRGSGCEVPAIRSPKFEYVSLAVPGPP